MVAICVKINRLLMSIILTIVALAVLLLILCAIKGKRSIGPEDYLKKMGYEFNLVDEKKIKIPKLFGENMQQYNELQKSQGFDLNKYSGKVCIQKKYLINANSEGKNNKTSNKTEKYVANLIVYDNAVVGGDLQKQYYDEETGPQKLDSLKSR